jgi:hypothetical protein
VQEEAEMTSEDIAKLLLLKQAVNEDIDDILVEVSHLLGEDLDLDDQPDSGEFQDGAFSVHDWRIIQFALKQTRGGS